MSLGQTRIVCEAAQFLREEESVVLNPRERTHFIEHQLKSLGLKHDQAKVIARPLGEIASNAVSAQTQLVKEGIAFAPDVSCVVIAITSTAILFAVKNPALDIHANRALGMVSDFYTCTERKKLKALKERLEMPVFTDENGLAYNGMGAGLTLIMTFMKRSDTFRLAVTPHPEGYDPRLRIVTTIFGVPKPTSRP